MYSYHSIHILWQFWLIATVFTGLFYVLMFRAGRRHRFLADTPVSKAKGVFVGQVELSGKAVRSPPARSWLAGIDCVWYRYTISEEWGRWETETYTDKDGKQQSRQVYRTGWTQIASGGEEPLFYIQDDTGAVLVRPEGASIEAQRVFSEVASLGQALYSEKTDAGPIAFSTGKRSFTEQAIPVDADLFVVGHARERGDIVAPEIAADRTQEMFLISCKTEAGVQSSYRWQFWGFGILMLPALPIATFVQLSSNGLPPNPWLILSVAATTVFLWFFGWLWLAFNSLVALRNRTVQGYSLVDVQLKRRADLIPSLVEITKGLRNYEATLQPELASLRSQAGATPVGQPGTDLAGSKTIVAVMIERYPELKANTAFLKLQQELSDTETRIALARDYYNSIATHLNTRMEIIPDRWCAPLAGLRPQELLVAEGFEREPVRLDDLPR